MIARVPKLRRRALHILSSASHNRPAQASHRGMMREQLVKKASHGNVEGYQNEQSFFDFTRGRFVWNEKNEMAERHTYFDVKELLLVAAKATGAKNCQSIEKFADGLFNKAFCLTMDDGRKFVAKLPNPNAGPAHYTTASEVATMDFMRTHLNTPVPKIYAWCSNAADTPVKSEYIIMEMAEGVQLETVWPSLDIAKRLEVVKSLWQYQKRWMSVSFDKYGSLYYARTLSDSSCNSTKCYGEYGQELDFSGFEIGPVTGRDWSSYGRYRVALDRGPWPTLEMRQAAVAHREAACIRQFDKFPKSPGTLFGPGTYEPSRAKKLRAIECHLSVLKYILPVDERVSKPYLWHTDLHAENIYVDSENPTCITAIIDWQSTEIAPLFTGADQTSHLNHSGATLAWPARPKLPDNLRDMQPAEQRAAKVLYYDRALEATYRTIVYKQAPILHDATEFRGTSSCELLLAPDMLLVDGEAQYMAQMLELEQAWHELPRVAGSESGTGADFPFNFSQSERAEIESDLRGAIEGEKTMQSLYRSMGSFWPEKGLVQHSQYDEARNALEQLKEQVVARYAKNEQEEKVWRENWPFDDHE